MGVIAVFVHSIQGVADMAGFLDKTDPYVELQVGNSRSLLNHVVWHMPIPCLAAGDMLQGSTSGAEAAQLRQRQHI